jgi:pSer/pThr/pTyr-binding forkhead associated (FHA) protein
MKLAPTITVQLVHIHGPMKGEIQEFSKDLITIGRLPASDLRVPVDLTIVSRKHAEIVREGNQFKLIDRSTNGTFVNGKKITEVLLRDGDVLEFADGGPKVSFLTQMKEAAETGTPLQANPQRLVERPSVRVSAEPPQEISVEKSVTPLVIQYGPTIRSYKELPVAIGRHQMSDFVLDSAGIYDQHAQVFFAQGQYWIKDLTGQRLIQINSQTINFQAPLTLNDNVALSPQGPVFRFLGEGRLAEVEEPMNEGVSASGEGERSTGRPEEKEAKGVINRIKKLF